MVDGGLRCLIKHFVPSWIARLKCPLQVQTNKYCKFFQSQALGGVELWQSQALVHA